MMVTFGSGRSRLSLLFAVMLTFSLLWFLSIPQETVVAAQSNFVGGDPSRPDSTDIRALRLRFEAGSRSNWHSHANWQILMAEEGRGQTQERGQDIQDLLPGSTEGWFHEGSLTTPLASQPVNRFPFSDPFEMSQAQTDAYLAVADDRDPAHDFDHGNRALQSLNGR